MKVYSIQIFLRSETAGGSKLLKGAYELGQFGYFQKEGVKQFMNFTGALLVDKTPVMQRMSVTEKTDREYVCSCYVMANNLAGVCITDVDYNKRVAHSLITKTLEDWQLAFPPEQWGFGDPAAVNFPQIEQHLADSQDPSKIDGLTKMQMDLDETKIILHDALDKVLQRGEQLDDLVAKSDYLSSQSKTFYTTAKKTNSCCTIL